MKSNPLRVGLVSDVGRIDDGTFNQYAYEGLMRATQELGIEAEIIETTTSLEYEGNVQQLVEHGCNVIVTVGSTYISTVIGVPEHSLSPLAFIVHGVIVYCTS